MDAKTVKHDESCPASHLELFVVLHLDTVSEPGDGGPRVGHDRAVEDERRPVRVLPDRRLGHERRRHPVHLTAQAIRGKEIKK